MCSFLDTSLRTQHTRPNFFKLLQMKPSPTWSIDSRQTAPDVRADVVDETTHWRNACKLSRQRLLDIGITATQIEVIRFAHHDPDYWRAEADLYDAEFWRLQQTRQSNKEQKRKKKKTKASFSADAPISSRLRKRTHEAKVTKSFGKARGGHRRVKPPIS
ncbi:hypothetical protein DL95DRAFT_398042 [Leptodontidium sp. 2 PMI_412]|nr:hypothetical protein DL95DRAFT_398042 [Leptodontidium sp. 2 PMI_412]